MPAIMKIYQDPGCTQEFNIIGSLYDHFVGSEYGLDGDKGDRIVFNVFVKNVGNRTALETNVFTLDDAKNHVYMADGTLDSVVFVNTFVELGDFSVGYSKEIKIRIVVPAGTVKEEFNPIFYVEYSTIP